MGHPAHVHLFRNAISILQSHNHRTTVAAVRKESTIQLLKHYKIAPFIFGVDRTNLVQKAIDAPLRDLQLLKYASDFKPDIIVSTGSPYAAQVSKVLGKPHIAFGDTEIASTITRLMIPFTDAVCTPSCFSLDLGAKHVKYDGYHELAYLHPNYFSPDQTVLEEIGIRKDEPYIIVRLASWTSSHDVGETGFDFKSEAQILDFLKSLENWGRVVLTTERRVPKEFERFVCRLAIHRIHDLLRYSTLYIGEGATMASEAGVLGIPWIFVSKAGRGYLDDQEKRYGLGFHVKTTHNVKTTVEKILSNKNQKKEWATKREKLLKDKIDVTAFIVNFIENWPESYRRIKEGKYNG